MTLDEFEQKYCVKKEFIDKPFNILNAVKDTIVTVPTEVKTYKVSIFEFSYDYMKHMSIWRLRRKWDWHLVKDKFERIFKLLSFEWIE